jgi:hypothetical protein
MNELEKRLQATHSLNAMQAPGGPKWLFAICVWVGVPEHMCVCECLCVPQRVCVI